MKLFRAAALGLVLAVCLAAAPAAFAEDGFTPNRRTTITERAGWLDSLVVRLADWLGWDGRLGFGADEPRSTVAAAKSPKPDGGGSTITSYCDESSGMDPVGNPCKP